MKTSNYILISFLIVFIGGNFISHLTAKNNLTVKVKPRYHFYRERLGSFSVVVAEPGANLKLRAGVGENLITENYENGNRIVTPYVVRNDTLFVSANPISSNFTCLDISDKNELKSLVAKEKSNIKIKATRGQHFTMKLYRAKLVIEDNISTYLARGETSIQANESEIVYERGYYYKMELNLNNSNFIANWPLPILLGSIRNGSSLNHKFGRPDIVNLNVDKSSSCYIK